MQMFSSIQLGVTVSQGGGTARNMALPWGATIGERSRYNRVTPGEYAPQLEFLGVFYNGVDITPLVDNISDGAGSGADITLLAGSPTLEDIRDSGDVFYVYREGDNISYLQVTSLTGGATASEFLESLKSGEKLISKTYQLGDPGLQITVDNAAEAQAQLKAGVKKIYASASGGLLTQDIAAAPYQSRGDNNQQVRDYKDQVSLTYVNGVLIPVKATTTAMSVIFQFAKMG